MNAAAAKLSTLSAPAAASRQTARLAPADSPMLELVRDEAGLLDLAPVWDDLLSRSAVRTPFLTWDWVSLWWEQYRDRFQPAIAVARDPAGTPLAIAPFFIGRAASGPRRHLRHLTFVGGIGDITSEGMDFIIPAGMEGVLAPLLCGAISRLRGAWDTIRLPMMHEESPNLPHILGGLRRTASGAAIVERQPSRFTILPASWEQVELSHGNNWRSNHRRKWRKMLAQHGGRTLLAGADLPGADAFEALVELHTRRWTPEQSLFLRERSLRFHRKLAARWIPDHRLDLSLLELDGKPAAATYCFLHDARAWFYQAGWNPDYGSISIGKLAVAWAVMCALRRGAREFDFLPGDYPYKIEWSNAVRHVVEIEGFNPLSLRATLFRILRHCKRRTTRAALHSAPAETDSGE